MATKIFVDAGHGGTNPALAAGDWQMSILLLQPL